MTGWCFLLDLLFFTSTLCVALKGSSLPDDDAFVIIDLFKKIASCCFAYLNGFHNLLVFMATLRLFFVKQKASDKRK